MMSERLQPLTIKDFESFAESHLSKSVWDFYSGGADDLYTLNDNVKAFQRYSIVPRLVGDVLQPDLRCSILGDDIAFPICIAPTAVHGLAHTKAETATARGAANAGVAYCQSSFSTYSIPEVAAAAPYGLRFLQLYMLCDDDLSLAVLGQAEQFGYTAVFLTVDTDVLGNRRGEDRPHFIIPDDSRLGVFQSLTKYKQMTATQFYDNWTEECRSPLSWDDVAWLKSVTKLKVVVKGILDVEDAKIAADMGVAGIAVSNHGGRQVDSAPATLDVLAEIVDAVGDRLEVFLDGGVRSGADAFKALALGAKAVFIGRPAIYGLVHSGEAGVQRVLNILRDELRASMIFAGCTSIKDISRQCVSHKSRLSSHL